MPRKRWVPLGAHHANLANRTPLLPVMSAPPPTPVKPPAAAATGGGAAGGTCEGGGGGERASAREPVRGNGGGSCLGGRPNLAIPQLPTLQQEHTPISRSTGRALQLRHIHPTDRTPFGPGDTPIEARLVVLSKCDSAHGSSRLASVPLVRSSAASCALIYVPAHRLTPSPSSSQAVRPLSWDRKVPCTSRRRAAWRRSATTS